MTIWQLTDADVEAVVNLTNQGRSLNEVAADLQMSPEMALCALRKWERTAKRNWVLNLF